MINKWNMNTGKCLGGNLEVKDVPSKEKCPKRETINEVTETLLRLLTQVNQAFRDNSPALAEKLIYQYGSNIRKENLVGRHMFIGFVMLLDSYNEQ